MAIFWLTSAAVRLIWARRITEGLAQQRRLRMPDGGPLELLKVAANSEVDYNAPGAGAANYPVWGITASWGMFNLAKGSCKRCSQSGGDGKWQA